MSIVRRILPPLASGALFGAGLAVGGMTDPDRVRGFLDLFGAWDPTLAFVMGGAVIVMVIAWRIQARLAQPLFAERFALPERNDLDGRLIAGSALFGIGWGIAGLCPGPAVASLALAPLQALPFLAAMLAGMAVHRILPARTKRLQPQGF